MTDKNGLAVGAIAVAATLGILLLAGSVLAQTGVWSPATMMGGAGGMMGSGMMGGASAEDMGAMHASCLATHGVNMTADMAARHAAMHG